MFPYLRQTRQKPLKNDRGRIVGTWTKAKYGLARESGAPGGIGYVGAACPLAGSFSTDATRLSFLRQKDMSKSPEKASFTVEVWMWGPTVEETQVHLKPSSLCPLLEKKKK